MTQTEALLIAGFFAAGAAMGWFLTNALLRAAREAGKKASVATATVLLMYVRSILIVGLFVTAGLQGLWAGPRAGLFALVAAIGGYLLTRRLLARWIRGRS